MKLWLACALLFVVVVNSQAPPQPFKKIAVFVNGDVSDVGWSFEVNTGRVLMETMLQIDSSTLVPNIATTDQAVDALRKYANDSYSLLMTTTFAHVAAVATVCQEYPNVKFMQANNVKPANCTNVVRVSWDTYQPYFLIGYYGGLMAAYENNNNVGMVVPGNNVNKPNTVNSFFTGMKRANRNAKLWTVSVDSYLDPDRSAGASDILLGLPYNVSVLCQNQDDFTVPIKAMNKGLLATGTTGFPLHQTYGQKVGLSFIMDWSPAFISYGAQVLYNNWTGIDMHANLTNRMFKLDVFSFRVPQAIQAAVMDQYAGILNGTVQILCSNTTFVGNPCMTNGQTNAYDTFPEITLITTYYVPTEEVMLPKGLVGVIAAFTAVCVLFVIICMIAAMVFKDSEVIRSASPTFLVMMCVGAFMLYASVLLRLPTATPETCSAAFWLLSLGFTVLFGHLVAKNYRIWRIFDDPLVTQVVIKNWQLLTTVGVILAMNIALLAAYQSHGGPDSQQDFGQNDDPYQYLSVCIQNSDGDALMYTLLAFHGILAVFGVFLAFRTRVIPPQFAKFKESTPIMYAIYDVAFCSCVCVPIMFLLPDAVTRVAVLCLTILFATTAAIGVIFMPKLWSLVKEGPNHQSGALGTTGGTLSGTSTIEVHN